MSGRNAKLVKPLYSDMEVRELPTFILFKAVMERMGFHHPKKLEFHIEKSVKFKYVHGFHKERAGYGYTISWNQNKRDLPSRRSTPS